MRKVMIMGCPGSGKTTLARKLSCKLNLPLVHLDVLNWRDHWQPVSTEEFDALLLQEVRKEAWIIDGNYLRTMECRLDACDTVFFLDYPLEICLEGAKARIGTVREDMPWVETEFDEEFRQWILDFPKDQTPVIYELLKKYETEKEIIVFKSRDEAEKFAYI